MESVAEVKSKSSAAGKIGAAVVGAAVGAAAGVAATILADPKKKKAFLKAASNIKDQTATQLDKWSKEASNIGKKLNKEIKTIKK